ncbi:hypothetical protein GCM10023196_091800 [Actinoallomurus vinaceus]|uniref:Uncharacterized protein n=1 Tax=Actinoallomurus vinaceus TaxID=1080074 RepID=A0ABP8UUH5_9ACTN
MNKEEIDLRAGLRRLTDQPRPLSISVETARAKGRRVLRRRRVGTAVGTAAAVGVAALGVLALPSGGEKPDGSVDLSSSSAQHSAYIARASFGWLPKGYRPTSTGFENGTFYLGASKGDSQFFLQMFPAGPEPALGSLRGGVPAKAVPAPSVGGHAAHWKQPPPPGAGTAPGEAKLRIQFGPKQWGELEYDAAPGVTDIKTTLYKVARAIKLRDTPQTFPLRLGRVPVGLNPGNVDVLTDSHSGIGWQTAITFEPGLQISVSLTGHTPTQWTFMRGAPKTTIDGHPATHLMEPFTGAEAGKFENDGAHAADGSGVNPSGGSEQLCVHGVHGLDVCYSATAQAGKLLKSTGGLIGLYKRTTVYTADPSTWTGLFG